MCIYTHVIPAVPPAIPKLLAPVQNLSTLLLCRQPGSRRIWLYKPSLT